MISFTLDTNCVIAVDENRTDAAAVMSLVTAHQKGLADVAVVAIMASERQRAGGYLENFPEFSARLDMLGMSSLGLCLPLGYFDICFWNHCIWSGDEQVQAEEQIHNVLFPDVEYKFADFCAKRGLDPTSAPKERTGKWRNAKCDVQALWSHINAKRDVFVTSDKNFLGVKRAALIGLGAGRIETPELAVTLL
jgi:hypothetical protein